MIKQAKTATMDDQGAESIIKSITEYYTVCEGNICWRLVFHLVWASFKHTCIRKVNLRFFYFENNSFFQDHRD